ncbi:MAG: hypothetical protein NC299_12745 [Lachnospiraceae bacterium]|nr:hypothetical protein [Ruminococcus sp.]MCM1276208.1 hypothetical protein [Lachnospiraceae bacterium]
MGFADMFKGDPLKKMFRGYDREEHEDIRQAAELISHSDPEVMKAVNAALSDPVKYLKTTAERLSERGIELDDEDTLDDLDDDEILFLSMLDELEEHGFAFEFDWKCELGDFLWGLEQIKGYEAIADVLKTVKPDESKDIEAWGKQINAALGETACVCYIDINSDSYPITILNYEILGELEIPFIMAM